MGFKYPIVPPVSDDVFDARCVASPDSASRAKAFIPAAGSPRVDLTLRPIGVVRAPYASVLDAPRQGEFATVESVIEVAPEFAAGLEGIERLDRVLVVWWAHLADRGLLQRAGADGAFTTRVPHRPNPIAISVVAVLRVEGVRLFVRGLEAIDGTPVLDLKSPFAEVEGGLPLPAPQPDAWNEVGPGTDGVSERSEARTRP